MARKGKEKRTRKPESVSAKLPKQKPVNTRAECAKAEALKPVAAANLSAGGGDRKSKKAKSGSSILTKAIETIDTREQAAKEAGVSTGGKAKGKVPFRQY